MRARVPASSANLGPGFDTLGLALARYTEVTVEPADGLRLTTEGEGSHLAVGPNHLAAQVVKHVLGHLRVRIHVSSDVPVARGMGSSAALIVAAAAAAGHPHPFKLASTWEGHADNAGAAVLGGLVTGALIDGKPIVRRLALDPVFRFVLVIPTRELRTKDARAALPEMVPHADAVVNLGRMGLLISGLADHRGLVPAAFGDRLHQNQRAVLYPEARPVMDAMVAAGALGSCWSGAGPALLAVCTDGTLSAVMSAAEAAADDVRLGCTVEHIQADTKGLVVFDD